MLYICQPKSEEMELLKALALRSGYLQFGSWDKNSKNFCIQTNGEFFSVDGDHYDQKKQRNVTVDFLLEQIVKKIETPIRVGKYLCVVTANSVEVDAGDVDISYEQVKTIIERMKS